jgi:putative membrane protein
MTSTRGFTIHAARWLAVAGIPLAVLGCQNEQQKTEEKQGMNPQGVGAPSVQLPSAAMRFDDTTRTNMLLRQIHAANQDEIEMGKQAMDKAQSPDVKKFASQMVTDHTAADQKLTDLAKKTNLDLNAAPMDRIAQALSSASDEHKRMVKGLSGPQFDAAYVAPQVDNHTLVLKFVEEAQKTASGDTRKLLDETRPVVESHLDHAKTLMRGLTFSPSAVGGGPSGGEGMQGGGMQGAPSKGDAGKREEPKKGGTKPNQPMQPNQ